MQFKTKRRINYWLRAKHRRGHGIHSPFLYRLISTVIEDKGYYLAYQKIKVAYHICRTKKKLMSTGSVSQKRGKLLFRLVNDFQPRSIHVYGHGGCFFPVCMALADSRISVKIVLEEQESEEKNRFLSYLTDQLSVANCITSPSPQQDLPDFALIDLDDATAKRSNQVRQLIHNQEHPKTMVICNIHKSPATEELWKEVKSHANVRVTLDLFSLGVVILDPKLQKENFTLRF